MAKKATRKYRTGSRGRRNTSRAGVSEEATMDRPFENFDLNNLGGSGIQRVFRNIYNNPVSLYLVGSVGAFFLGRFAYRYYQNHPEISEFIRDNFDTVENRLRDYRSTSQDEDVAHH